MNTPNLSQLADIHLPPPVSLWPLAPGWYFLALLFIGCCLLMTYILCRYWQRHRLRKHILQHINLLHKTYEEQPTATRIIADISILLRRAALAVFPRQQIASLQGEAWLQFLNDTGKTTEFTKPHGRLLITAAYQKEHHADLTPLFSACRHWVKTLCLH